MRYYELTCLISLDLSSEGINSFQEKIISHIQDEKGILIKTNKVSKKILGLPVRKEKEVLLLSLDFQLNPEGLENLERKLKAESQILRYLLIAEKIPAATEVAEKSSRFPRKIVKPKLKVELKEIEKKLEEILGE